MDQGSDNPNSCVHDPNGLLVRCFACDPVYGNRAYADTLKLDENKAYLDTAAWLKHKSGTNEHSVEAELRILNEMYSLPDERTQL